MYPSTMTPTLLPLYDVYLTRGVTGFDEKSLKRTSEIGARELKHVER